jgi:hypothetical protein
LVDLNQTIEIEYREKVNKPDGGVMIRAMVPGITKDWPMPLHLTPEQAEALGDPTSGARFKVKLVQSSLKDGKDGSWPSDFWYNVAIFEGVVDERNIKKESFLDSVKSASSVATDMPKVVPTVQAPSATGLIKEEELSQKDRIIVQEIALKLAFEQTSGDTLEEHVYNASLLYPKILDVFYGRFKASPLVEEASKQGAKIVEIRPDDKPEESSLDNAEWDYKQPKELKSRSSFVEYMQKCGWSMDDVVRWLGVKELEDYVSITGNGYMKAAKTCKDKALEEGLEPPEDFRQEKK